MTVVAERPAAGPRQMDRAWSRVLGSTTPRLYTPPLRKLTPSTSIGFRHCEWARDTLLRPFYDWQAEAVIRAGELRRDGSLRFRKVFVIVARQNGKTEIPVVLGAYWLFEDEPGLTVGTSTVLDYAHESLDKLVQAVEANDTFDDLREGDREGTVRPRWVREANGEVEARSRPRGDGRRRARYKIAAKGRKGGRSLTVRRLVLDELREHHDYSAWSASVPAQIKVPDAQAWILSNAGDDKSVVLNDQRALVVAVDADGREFVIPDRDTDTLWLEWSAPPGARPLDPRANAQANPTMNRPGGIAGRDLYGAARAAVAAGGERLTSYQTEHMCIRVRVLVPALDLAAWERTRTPGDLAAVRDRVGLFVDASPDMQGVALYAAAMVDARRIRVDHVASWSGPGAVRAAARDVPDWLARVRPRRFGWLGAGPAAALSADLEAIRDGTGPRPRPWPAAVEFMPLTDAPAVCMGFAAAVEAEEILHVRDPLLDTQAEAAEPLKMKDRWVFSRQGGHVHAVYAAAGAADLARTMPAPVGDLRLIVADDDDDR